MNHREFTQAPRIAYFSMEIALRNEIPTYAGGLGVLAGDSLRSAADLDLPMVAVTLVCREGHFRQEIDPEGRQIEHPNPWDPSKFATLLDAKIALEIERRRVWVQGWLYVVEGQWGGRVPVILLDTDLPENEPVDREITHRLYGGDLAYRFKQEMVLGFGGLRMLQALGFTIRQYHMNEGHSALLALGLLQRTAREPGSSEGTGYDVAAVRESCVFTTHTPVESGHDQFPYDLVRRVMGDNEDEQELRRLAGQERLNMTALALHLSGYVNGVAMKHAQVSRSLFPDFVIHAVTNGIHSYTWACEPFRKVYDEYIPRWAHGTGLLVRADQIPDDVIWQAHLAAKRSLLSLIREKTGAVFREDVPIIAFARRMTGYKRPGLLLADRNRLRAIARTHPFQVVWAGKAHPRDEMGKRSIQELHRAIGELKQEIPMAFLPNYDMETAQALVSGADLWLNTPLPPLEASGTSGMKAAVNGVPSLSVLDGWWIEGHIEGVTGWAIESPAPGGSKPDGDAEGLYRKLEKVVLPLYQSDRAGWIRIMKGAIGKNAQFFNSHRMMRRYASEAYIR